MKKLFYILIFISALVIYKVTENYFNSYIDSDNPCVTIQKIEGQAEEYKKLVYDENGNHLRYDELRKAFFDDIVQNGKYRMYIVDVNRKMYVDNEKTLVMQGFPGMLLDVYPKNSEVGQRLYMIVEENRNGKEVFRMKRYQMYPYKKLINMSYTGAASTVVQFRCELERDSKNNLNK